MCSVYVLRAAQEMRRERKRPRQIVRFAVNSYNISATGESFIFNHAYPPLIFEKQIQERSTKWPPSTSSGCTACTFSHRSSADQPLIFTKDTRLPWQPAPRPLALSGLDKLVAWPLGGWRILPHFASRSWRGIIVCLCRAYGLPRFSSLKTPFSNPTKSLSSIHQIHLSTSIWQVVYS